MPKSSALTEATYRGSTGPAATTTTMKLEDLTPSEVRDAAARGVPLLLPVGVLEWHGWCAVPHCCLTVVVLLLSG